MTDSVRQTTRPPLSVLWRARRELGAWVSVGGHTPEGEPVLVAGTDRLVLRTDGRFWPARRCGRCTVEVASPNLERHERDCTRTPTATRETAAPPVVGAVRPEDGVVAFSVPTVAPRRHVAPTTEDGTDRAVGTRAPKRRQKAPEPAKEARRRPFERSPGRAVLTAQTVQRATPLVAVVALAACAVAVVVFLRWLSSDSGPTNARSTSAPETTAPPVSQVMTAAPQPSPGPGGPAAATASTTVGPPTTRPAPAEANGSALAAQIAFLEQVVADARTRVVQSLPNDVGRGLVQSVERFEFVPARPTIRLELTSPATSPAQLREAAWAVTERLLPVWDAAVVKRVPNAVPAFRLSLNKTEVECSANLMMRLAYGGGSQEQWAAECGGGFR